MICIFVNLQKMNYPLPLWHPAILAIIGSLKARHLLINDNPMGAAPVAV